jgi:hypothetical protein
MAIPDEVKSAFGFALYLVQQGKKNQNAKPLKGFSIHLAGQISFCIYLTLPPGENFVHKINMSFVWS